MSTPDDKIKVQMPGVLLFEASGGSVLQGQFDAEGSKDRTAQEEIYQAYTQAELQRVGYGHRQTWYLSPAAAEYVSEVLIDSAIWLYRDGAADREELNASAYRAALKLRAYLREELKKRGYTFRT